MPEEVARDAEEVLLNSFSNSSNKFPDVESISGETFDETEETLLLNSFSQGSFGQTELSSFSKGSFTLASGGSGSLDDPGTDVSLAGSVGSLDGCSVDSIGRMLIKLEENDVSLTELTIDCTSIDKEAAAEVAWYLPRNKHLKKLRLFCGSRSSSRHRHIFRKVVEGLKTNKSVAYIVIQGVDISRSTATWIVPSFIHNQSLEHVILINCKGLGLEDLIVGMQRNERIKRLTFHSCYYGKNISAISWRRPSRL